MRYEEPSLTGLGVAAELGIPLGLFRVALPRVGRGKERPDNPLPTNWRSEPSILERFIRLRGSEEKGRGKRVLAGR